MPSYPISAGLRIRTQGPEPQIRPGRTTFPCCADQNLRSEAERRAPLRWENYSRADDRLPSLRTRFDPGMCKPLEDVYAICQS